MEKPSLWYGLSSSPSIRSSTTFLLESFVRSYSGEGEDEDDCERGIIRGHMKRYFHFVGNLLMTATEQWISNQFECFGQVVDFCF